MQKFKRKPRLTQLVNTLASLTGLVTMPLNVLVQSRLWQMTAVLIVICLAASWMLSGCSPRIVRPPLPAQADPRPIPEFTGRTGRDVVLYAIEVRESNLACEADKAAIRYIYRAPGR